MKSVGRLAVQVVAGLLLSGFCCLAQNYTISARPGAVNYVEGEASINGKALPRSVTSGKVFLNANDTLSTGNGKAEFLLTPGVFVRVGENSQVRMVSPDLTATQVEVLGGSAMVEVDQLVKENNIQILDSGATVKLQKDGLYRFTAGPGAVAQAFDGRADVSLNGRSVELGKGRQVTLAADLKREKIEGDPQDTSLYAWSKVRDEYDAAASYASSRAVGQVSVDPYWGGFGWSGYGFTPGWTWNPFWSAWSWIPADGLFYSPFGFGFYAPVYAAYAPVIVSTVGGKPVQVPVTIGKPVLGTSTYHPGYFNGQPIRWANPSAAMRAGLGSEPRASSFSGGSTAGSTSVAAPRISSSSGFSSSAVGHASGGGGGSHH